ncbi:MAG: hypothetical protein QM831_27835 [Kofleriaceae bacterium]
MKRFLVLALVSGCSLYWGGDDDDMCNYGDDVAVPAGGAPQAFRDPTTGTCQYIDTGGGGCTCPCGETCECPATGIALPNEGQCYTQCDSLTEDQCLTAPGCHAAYDDESREALGNGSDSWTTAIVFMGCWATPQMQSQQTKECSGLDAYSCQDYDNCSMWYADTGYSTQFEQCVDETASQPTDPGACGGSITCGVQPPICPANTTPGIANGCWTGYCIPNADCGSHDPGQCYAPVTCNMGQPSCPAGTEAGVVDGCYSGYCIPDSACEKLSCEQLPDQASCTSRADCQAVYTGTNCTCDSNGCTCQDETYTRCEVAPTYLPD